jgi:UDP-N-acetylglucosamine transferase subunit ALG13
VTLITVGTQFFDSLLRECDRLAGQGCLPGPVRAQIGTSRFEPRNMSWFRFCSGLREQFQQADLVIAHGGTGTVCELIEAGVPFIAVVNHEKAGDHQLEFLEDLSAIYDLCWVRSPAELAEAIPAARPARRRGEPGTRSLGFATACSGPAGDELA